MSQPLPIAFPTRKRQIVEQTFQRYRIRPYHPRDHAVLCQTFMEGMTEYSNPSSHPVFPSLDEEHALELQRHGKLWSQGFLHYTDHALSDPNMQVPHHYFSLPRRAMMLIAEEIATGNVVGCVAIQPVEFGGDTYANLVSQQFPQMQQLDALGQEKLQELQAKQQQRQQQHESNTENNGDDNSEDNHTNGGDTSSTTALPTVSCPIDRQFLDYIQFAAGNLPSEYYQLDDPHFDSQSYQFPQPTVLLPLPPDSLPPADLPQNIIAQHQHPPESAPFEYLHQLASRLPPRPPQLARCACARSKTPCRSHHTAIKLSQLSFNQQLEVLRQSSPERLQELFCPCIRNANQILLQAQQQRTFPHGICPYCIHDAQYLVYPYLHSECAPTSFIQDNVLTIAAPATTSPVEGETVNSSTQRISFEPNPAALVYPNEVAKLFLQRAEGNPDQRLPYYRTAPHGYFRRFTPCDNFYVPLPANRDIYRKYLAQITADPSLLISNQIDPVPTLIEDISRDVPRDDRFNYETHVTIPSDLKRVSPNDFTTNECELRRMSIKKAHRGTGLAYLLIYTAFQTARDIFMYDMIHLTTSQVMELAVTFYRKMGMRETLTQLDWIRDDHAVPVVHFTQTLTSDRNVSHPIRFRMNRPWRDWPLTCLVTTPITAHVPVEPHEEVNNKASTIARESHVDSLNTPKEDQQTSSEEPNSAIPPVV